MVGKRKQTNPKLILALKTRDALRKLDAGDYKELHGRELEETLNTINQNIETIRGYSGSDGKLAQEIVRNYEIYVPIKVSPDYKKTHNYLEEIVLKGLFTQSTNEGKRDSPYFFASLTPLFFDLTNNKRVSFHQYRTATDSILSFTQEITKSHNILYFIEERNDHFEISLLSPFLGEDYVVSYVLPIEFEDGFFSLVNPIIQSNIPIQHKFMEIEKAFSRIVYKGLLKLSVLKDGKKIFDS